MQTEYCIACTGDCVVGDEVIFERDIWGGSFRKPKHIGTKIVEGKIIKDSYGEKRQQHTFTILTEGDQILIKGRNLYKYGVNRKPWPDESAREEVLKEKHARGNKARRARNARILQD